MAICSSDCQCSEKTTRFLFDGQVDQVSCLSLKLIPRSLHFRPLESCVTKLIAPPSYDNPTGKAAVEKHNYTGHIRRIGEEKLSKGKKSILLGGGLWKGH